jgi:hypothetical protein
VPAEDLEELNRHIVGETRVTEAFLGTEFTGALDPNTKLPTDLVS